MWGENKLIIQELTGSKWQRCKNEKGLLYMQSDGKIKGKAFLFFETKVGFYQNFYIPGA